MNLRVRARRAAVGALALAALHGASAQTTPETPAPAPHEHAAKGFVLFLHAGAHHISANRANADLNEDAWAAGDLVLALTRDRFRLFGEYLLSSDEHDLERLQFGYEPIANTVLWLGRFHQPASAWNTEHHHGRYLQTAVTRPSIELWEDEEGVITQHLTGALVETRMALGTTAGVVASIGAGLGARVEREGLDPFDLLDMHPTGRRISWTARAAFLPDYVGSTQVGLLAARHRMPVVDGATAAALGAQRVGQTVWGLYADWHGEPWRVLAAAYNVRLSLEGGAASRREHFTAAYAQVERQLPNGFTAYGRQESSSRLAQSVYVATNHAGFLVRRSLLGARFDFRPRQAISLEVARGATLQGRQNEYRLQWSAALP